MPHAEQANECVFATNTDICYSSSIRGSTSVRREKSLVGAELMLSVHIFILSFCQQVQPRAMKLLMTKMSSPEYVVLPQLGLAVSS